MNERGIVSSMSMELSGDVGSSLGCTPKLFYATEIFYVIGGLGFLQVELFAY
jgi:hypothetical protein